MTTQQENTQLDPNTPRTRNRLLDGTRPMKKPEGYTGTDWTFRKQLEAEFRALGFRSHRFSHKNEPENRLADSLWLSWNCDNKKQPVGAAVTDIEARVTFAVHRTPYYEEHETTITITHDGRGSHGCLPRRMGKSVFVIENSDTTDILDHVKHLITKPSI